MHFCATSCPISAAVDAKIMCVGSPCGPVPPPKASLLPTTSSYDMETLVFVNTVRHFLS